MAVVTTSTTNNIGLLVDSDITPSARSNLLTLDRAIGSLGANYTNDGVLRINSVTDMILEPNSPAVSGTGVGGTVQIGTPTHLVNLLLYLSSFDISSPLGLKDEAPANFYLRLGYNSILDGGPVDTADRALTFDVQGADRAVILGGNLRIGSDLVLPGAYSVTLTATGTTALTLPTSGTLATLAGIETLSNKTLASPGITTFARLLFQGQLRFADADSSNYVGFQAPAVVPGDFIWTLPALDGTANQVLTTNGAGTLSWTAATTATLPFHDVEVGSAANIRTPVDTSVHGDVLASAINGLTLKATGVTSGTYGSSNTAVIITVGVDGRLTTVGTASISITASQVSDFSSAVHAIVDPGTLTIGNTVSGGTAGSVLFVDPTGKLGQDNAHFFWDDANNRLGLGTPTPLRLLHAQESNATNYVARVQNSDASNPETLELLAASTSGTIQRWVMGALSSGISGTGAGMSLSLGGTSSILDVGTTTGGNSAVNINGFAALTNLLGGAQGLGLGGGYNITAFYTSGFNEVARITTAGLGVFNGAPVAGIHLGAGIPVLATTANDLFVTGTIETAAGFAVQRSSATVNTFLSNVVGDVNSRLTFHADGKMLWGSGAAAPDTDLYRVGVGQLKTDTQFLADSLSIGSAKFTVSTTGDLTKVNNVAYTWPSTQGASNTFLRDDGSGGLTWTAISLSSSVTGTLPIANGGTGQTTANAAFAALSPMTTNGDLITRAGGVPTRLGIGSTGQILQVVAGAPVWGSIPLSTSNYATTWTTGTTFTANHALGSVDVNVQLYDIDSGDTILVDTVSRNSAPSTPDSNNVYLTSSVVPTGSGWRVLVSRVI